MNETGLLIIGGGPTGLTLSMACAGPTLVLEAAGEVGGLCRSMSFGGGVFDLGGHSFHSPYAEVTELIEGLMAGRWSRQRRDARVLVGGQLIDYPFQNHVSQIDDPAMVADCLAGQPDPAAAAEARTLHDWLPARFGEGIARHFLRPYNTKLWARDLREISCAWVSERIAGGETAAPGVRRAPLQSSSEVGYPLEGGFGEIWRRMSERGGPVALGQAVRRIDPAARTARTASGETFAWRTLVSTMPLPALMQAIEGCPEALVAACQRLQTVSLKIVMHLVDGPVGAAPQRVYSAAAHVPGHKIAFNHTSSPVLRALPTHAVMAEVAYSPSKPVAGDADLAASSAAALAGAGLIGAPASVLETRVVDLPLGYPVQTADHAAIVAAARAWLEPRGIHTLGRFGAWEYVNSDACVWQALRLAERLGLSRRPG